MAINRNVDDPSIAHTINEFISAGQNGDNDYKLYKNFTVF